MKLSESLLWKAKVVPFITAEVPNGSDSKHKKVEGSFSRQRSTTLNNWLFLKILVINNGNNYGYDKLIKK